MNELLKEIRWNDQGLVPVVVQDALSGEVLMLAWMNEEALRATLESGYATFWSRSRQKLWKKGETSGHLQKVKEISLDCDGDTLLLKVVQIGGIACHTGRRSCFYRKALGGRLQEISAPIKPPEEIDRNG